LAACRAALAQGLLAAAPDATLDKNGYVADPAKNLIEGIRLEDMEADLRKGSDNELAGKFRAAHCSAALAVNCFAPFKAVPEALVMPGGGAFSTVQFERKCPHGLRRGTPPNLDVLAEGPDAVTGIESKCLEVLSRHIANFAPAYDAEIIDHRRQSAWFRVMQTLVETPTAYTWLDAAQLIKHAFGLTHTFPNHRVNLLYLFWEPSNAEAHPVYAAHRAEIARFAEAVAGATPHFMALSYPELWETWDARPDLAWLPPHTARLRARYYAPA
jgi:hypothetical protein